MSKMQQYNLCLLGFGNVGRGLARLLLKKTTALREQYGIDWRITGVASRGIGWIVSPDGFDVSALLAGEDIPKSSSSPQNVREWLQAARADVLFEVSSLNPLTGDPAIGHLRAALESGAHAITANKGPIVHAYRELRDLAQQVGKQFMFEATVIDGVPIFSLFRETLPAAELRGFRGIFNSTTSVILAAMEEGLTFEEGVRRAQELGVAETDPSADVDGWDATVKVCALASVLMNTPLKPEDVKRVGIRDLDTKAVQAARAAGQPYKLVSQAKRTDNGRIIATVRPEQLAQDDQLASISEYSLMVQFDIDTLSDLTISARNPGPETTAYGLLSDFINAVRKQKG